MDKQTEKILKEENFTIVNLYVMAKKKAFLFFAVMALFFLMGIVYYYTTPKEYSTTSVLLVETQEGNDVGGLSSLAAVAGFGNGGVTGTSTLDPALYPVILQSKPYLEDLINSKVKSRNYEDSVTIFKYMVETMPGNYIAKFLKRPMAVFDEPTVIDDQARLESRPAVKSKYESLELLILYQMAERINYSAEGRILTIVVTMPEAELAYQFSLLVQKLLIDYSTEYLQEKQKGQVEYLEEQHLKSEENFKEAQATLTSFRERNQGIYLESQKAIEQNLNSDYNLKFELYRTISQELERARIELNSQKPIFTEIEPPFIPNRPSSPRWLITLAFCFALGFVFGLITVFVYYLRAYFLLKAQD
ncbi:Wzz/FepE/Etk N-terminal domain-containing protein [Algoriphagus sediminis]|uniref:Wzz/FepE/Etk N-terminal domain-containing protein n=1 Tax=Algoriphagus sediminis TaxID=3057113 RepID=A0ABT7YE11_9BACT|nr:Wzz/FepE/Etk N-terminal domain-containing protein [Algoriphagus sediminis]MDN3204758.1 Wzz/FepE/Etk N-terminal domain-containing protein [Algoriphagus sediminis]